MRMSVKMFIRMHIKTQVSKDRNLIDLSCKNKPRQILCKVLEVCKNYHFPKKILKGKIRYKNLLEMIMIR